MSEAATYNIASLTILICCCTLALVFKSSSRQAQEYIVVKVQVLLYGIVYRPDSSNFKISWQVVRPNSLVRSHIFKAAALFFQ
jgi:hypothetical protein